jgi:hypothetical protein
LGCGNCLGFGLPPRVGALPYDYNHDRITGGARGLGFPFCGL